MVKDWANTFHKTFKIVENPNTQYPMVRVLRYVICRDGFKFSLQAGPSHYSEPKAIADYYSAFEIGYPSAVRPLWLFRSPRPLLIQHGQPCFHGSLELSRHERIVANWWNETPIQRDYYQAQYEAIQKELVKVKKELDDIKKVYFKDGHF